MDSFLSALVTLLVIIDPLGTAAVFSALTFGATQAEQRAIARTAGLVAGGVLVFFGLLGGALLAQLGISLSAFRIAGGLLLFVIAFRMLMGQHDQASLRQPGSVYADRTHLAIFPLAIPLLSGPGCITAMILLNGQARDLFARGMVFLALFCALAIAFSCMMLSGWLKKLLGAGGMVIIARLIGIVLAAMAVQFVIDGIGPLLHAAMVPA